MGKKKQIGYCVVDLINNGEIINLADIDWRKATKDWDKEAAKSIIDGVQDRTLKPAIIDVMLSEWRYNKSAWDFGMEFSDFLESLKKHIQNYDYFNIEALKKLQIKEIGQMKRDIELLK